jgi:hypothetical protein
MDIHDSQKDKALMRQLELKNKNPTQKEASKNFWKKFLNEGCSENKS